MLDVVLLNGAGARCRAAPRERDILVVVGCRTGGETGGRSWKRVLADSITGYLPAGVIRAACGTACTHLKTPKIPSRGWWTDRYTAAGRRRAHGGQRHPTAPGGVVAGLTVLNLVGGDGVVGTAFCTAPRQGHVAFGQRTADAAGSRCTAGGGSRCPVDFQYDLAEIITASKAHIVCRASTAVNKQTVAATTPQRINEGGGDGECLRTLASRHSIGIAGTYPCRTCCRYGRR